MYCLASKPRPQYQQITLCGPPRGAMAASLRRICGTVQSAVRYFCSKQVVSAQDEEVEQLLLQMTGMDLDKIFAPRKEALVLPHYKLMNEQQVEEAHAETVERARELLRMPLILPQRSPKGEVLEENSRLAGLLEYSIVFTDITQHREHKSRRMVVRETSGHLREATWEERDRMRQVYFPELGRQLHLPAILQEKNLPAALQKRDCHVDILDLVCVQCEPDSEDYIRVYQTVYADIDKRGLYDVLRSTRHFGGLLWKLMTEERIQGLLKDMLTRQLMSDAEDLVRLHLLCYPESAFAQAMRAREDCNVVQAFCAHMGFSQLLQLCPTSSEQIATADSNKCS